MTPKTGAKEGSREGRRKEEGEKKGGREEGMFLKYKQMVYVFCIIHGDKI